MALHSGLSRQMRPPAHPGPAAPADRPPPAPPAGAATATTELLTPAAAAARLGVSEKVMERWRGTGGGPLFVKMTHKTLRYRKKDLDAFVESKVRTNTTAQ